MEKQKKNLGSVAFLPLIVFLVCYVGCGITFTLMGADDPFGKFPRHVALLAGCAVALLLNRSMDVKDKIKHYDDKHGKFWSYDDRFDLSDGRGISGSSSGNGRKRFCC